MCQGVLTGDIGRGGTVRVLRSNNYWLDFVFGE